MAIFISRLKVAESSRLFQNNQIELYISRNIQLKENMMYRPIFLIAFIISILSCKNSEEKKEQIKIDQYDVATNQDNEQSELEMSISRGKEVYSDFCMQCHMPNGKGIPGNFPPLAGSNWLTEKREASIHAVKYGQNGEIQVNGVTYNNVMAPMGLSDKEVADVLNYAMNSWGNTQVKMVTVDEVKAVSK